jgi:hypothetical protein
MSRRIILLGVCLLSPQFKVYAQATASATLNGTVFDSSGAALPKAELELTNPDNGFSRTQTSGESGAYSFSGLAAGTYKLSVKAPGFQPALYEKINLQVATATQLNATLNPGQQSSIVNVQEAAPLLDTNKTDVSVAFTPAEVQNLPLSGRDFASLAFLAPGAKPVNSYDPTKNRMAVFGINGSTGRNVNVTVNGIDNKDNTVGGPVMQLPLEAVQEFNLSTQRFSAANGRSEGAAVNVITKSGSNDFHGSLFLFARDTALNANDYFTEQAHGSTPPYSRQQYGGSVGGPVKKDKVFLFFALERQREQQQITTSANAFNELTLAKPLGAVPATTIPIPYNDQRYTGRLDWNINSSNTFSASYNSQSNSSLNDQSSTTTDLTEGNFTTNQLILANATLNSVLSPRIVNSFTAGYQYWNNLIDTTARVPFFTFPSGASFGTNGNVPQESYQKKWQFRDDLSFTRDKHSFKVGIDFVNVPKLGGFFGNTVLNYTFLADPSTILGNPALYPQGFATAGLLGSVTASAGNPYFATNDGKMLGVYFQDDYKVSRHLNLSLGIRWDKDYNLNGGNTQARSLTYQDLLKIGSPYAGIPKNDNLDFSPRFGFAYDVTGSGHHVIRGGYGIYYGQIFENIPLFTQQQENSVIYTGTLNLTSSGAGSPTASIVPGTNIRLSNYRFGVDPPFVVPQPAPGVLPAGSTGRLVNPDYHNPYNQEFNLGYSWQISPNDVIEVEGIHSLALRESKRVNINPQLTATGTRVLAPLFSAAGVPALAQIVVESSVGRSRYDALNVSYRRRLSRHFTVNTNYVRSRALAYTGSNGAFNNASPDPNNLFGKGELGPTPNDEPHRWVLSGIYQAPFGLQFAPIVQWASGRPWNPTEGIDVYGFGGGNGTWRAVVPTASPTNYRATATYTAAQLRAGLADGSLMTLPYDALRGNRFFQMDLRVSKVFVIKERHRIELLCQMFNLTNRANFGNNYTLSIRSSDFGKPSNFLSTSGTIVPHAFQAEMGFQYRF